MIQRSKKDEEKTFSLVELSDEILIRLEEIGNDKFPTSTLIDYYTVLHSLCEAVACLRGYKFRGEGAHKELIETVLKNYKSKQLIQELRELRNKAHYEGRKIQIGYIKINEKEIKETIAYLKNIIVNTTKSIK